MKARPILLSLTLGALAGCASAPAAPPADDDADPDAALADAVWSGAVSLPGGQSLGFSVQLTRGMDGAPTGTISIPLQGVVAAPLTGVSDDGARIAFTLDVPGAAAHFAATRDESGQNATGVLKQSGLELPLQMRKLGAGEVAELSPKRPQTPTPPFPYAEREATWEHAADGVTLAGTLTYPDDGARHPAVLLITGSGRQDRDETIFAHKPFWVLADALTRRGFAVLRVDDRGAGGSTAGSGPVTVQSNLRDVLASLAYLAAQPEVDAARVGVVGHSEGGILAAMAAAERPEQVAFAVALAGTGVPGEALLVMQLDAIGRADGASAEELAMARAQQRTLLQLVRAGADEATLRAALEQAVQDALANGSPAVKAQVAQVGADALVAERLAQLRDPWLASFVRLDPRDAWRMVRCPVLVLIGEKDLQVPPEPNLAGIRAALATAKNPDVTLETVPGLNHLFQTAQTGSVSEYATLEETLAPTVLTRVGDWLTVRATAGQPSP